MKARAVAVLALVAAVAAAIAASTAGAGSSSATATQAVNCNGTLKIGIITPLTGGAGFLGQEQLSWTQYAVSRLATRLGPAGAARARRHAGREGPGRGSRRRPEDDRGLSPRRGDRPGDVGRGAPRPARRCSPPASRTSTPSATRTSLTYGSNKEATPAFFRVVPGDNIQGPTDANFMADKLNAKKVVLIDFQEPYSVGLADSTEAALKRKGVTTIRQSTSVNTTDFSSLVTRVPNDADFVFFPTQQPPDAQTFGQQLLEQGKRAKVFGGDGANNPAQFKLAGSYVSNFAPDISGIASSKALLDGWKRANPSATARLVRPAGLPRNAGRAAGDQAGVRRRQGQAQYPQGHHQAGQEGAGPELDPRRLVPLLDEDERPAEREVLHLPDPAERHVQARQLVGSGTTGAARHDAGPLPLR